MLIALRRRSVRPVPLALLVLTLALTVGLFGWFLRATMHQNAVAFAHDVEIADPVLRAEVDSVLLSVKDAAAFVAGGRAETLRVKLTKAGRRSAFMSRLGTFNLSNPAHVRALMGTPLPLLRVPNRRLEAIGKLLRREIGVTFTISPRAQPDLLPDLDADELIIMQAMPIAGGRDHAVVYAVFNLKDMIAAAGAKLPNSAILDVTHILAGRAFGDALPAPARSVLDRVLAPREAAVTVSVVRNLIITVTLRQRIETLLPLFVTLAGLVAIGTTGGILVVAGRRLRRVAEQQLRDAVVEAQRGNEAKSVFLANMSHEIRTPLNGVLGMADLLVRTPLTATQQRYVREIRTSGSTLLALLNDILDLSKLEGGHLTIDLAPTRLVCLMTEIAAFYGPLAQRKDIDLYTDVDPTLPLCVETDAVRLRQILSNLLTNAIKFTPAGEIVLSATAERERSAGGTCLIRFSVRDTGIGIAQEAVGRLFTRFTQAEAETSRLYGGTGLGLAICKEIAELMGGAIGVASAHGYGSTFTLTLPMRVVEGPAAMDGQRLRIAVASDCPTLNSLLLHGLGPRGVVATIFPTFRAEDGIAKLHREAPLDAIVVDQGRHLDAPAFRRRLARVRELATVQCLILGRQPDSPDYEMFDQAVVKPFDCGALVLALRRTLAGTPEPTRGGAAGTGRRAYHGRRALLVDDNSVNLLFGTELLRDLGFEVITAENGAAAVDAATAGDFDIIFLDIQMPVMDGYAASRALRAMMAARLIPEIPIVAVTANALRGSAQRCRDSGMTAVVTKPLSQHDIATALRSVLAEAEAALG